MKYSIYNLNYYARVSNIFVGSLAKFLIKRFRGFFKPLFFVLQQSGIKLLSRSYVSVILFSSFLGFLLSGVLTVVILRNNSIYVIIFRTLINSVLAFITIFGLIYLYPYLLVSDRKRDIKNKLPFAIIHMSAIAGSGAPPLTIFELILKSGEYGELSSEIKKIINYTNLFGYNLSSALRRVALTTSSEEFKELLNGMTTTIESGGDLKNYLKEKAEDVMTAYRLERKKHTQVISTYSDIYTGVLIAAPLLFIVVLTIINSIGGKIAGVDANIVANIGTYVFIPFINIIFMLFLSITQPEI